MTSPPSSPSTILSSSHLQSMNNLSLGLFIYISTGILQPIVIDTLRMKSLLGHHYLLLPTLANTTGMALCGLLASKSQWCYLQSILSVSASSSSSSHNNNNNNNNNVTNNNHKFKQMIILTSLIDLLSGMALTFGIFLTGGAIFVILYNSCPAWTAILSRIILKKKMKNYQFGGVVLVCIGLIVNIVFGRGRGVGASNKDYDDSHDNSSLSSSSYGVIFGSIVVLIGSLLHSLMFVLSDLSLRSLHHHNSISDDQQFKEHTSTNGILQKNNSSNDHTISISGEIWSCCLGSIEASFMTVWVLIGILTTGFHDNNEIKNNITFLSILGGFLFLVIIDTLHAAAFFTLLKNIGAVGSALLKGMQTVVVIALSALLFCGKEESQCLDTNKVLSASLVLGGVFLYAGVRTVSNGKDNIINSDGSERSGSEHLCHSTAGHVVTTSYLLSEKNGIEMKALL